MLKWLHPMRTSRYLRSEKFLPLMHLVAAAAEQVRKNRMNVPDENPLRTMERTFSGHVTKAIEMLRQSRDHFEEDTFRRIYG